MAEINVKSPQFKQRDVDTISVVAEMTIGSGVTDAIDLPGLSIGTVLAESFVISGIEAELDVSLDSTRRAGFQLVSLGTVVGNADPGDVHVVSAVISGSAGSRIITVTLADGTANLMDLTADSFADAVVQIHLPIKAKDF